MDRHVDVLRAEFAEVCEFIPAGTVNEFEELFSEFTPVATGDTAPQEGATA